jgi:hypothetical protein
LSKTGDHITYIPRGGCFELAEALWITTEPAIRTARANNRAADYQEDEYLLLGMAIKYGGLRGKKVVRILPTGSSSGLNFVEWCLAWYRFSPPSDAQQVAEAEREE